MNESTSKNVAVTSSPESESKSIDSTSSDPNKRKIPFESEYCKRSCTRLYLQKETADVHFLFDVNGEEKKLPAHKYLLAIGSPVFQRMFYGDLKEEGDVTISDASVEAFEEFLQFFYLTDVALTIENAPEILNLVNKYAAVECFPICEKFLLQNLTMDSVCWALNLASIFDRTEFHQSLLKKVMDAPREVFSSESFKECTMDTLKMILECESLNCQEAEVFDACIAWSKNACIKNDLNPSLASNLRQQLGDCFYLIKFSEMQPQQISNRVSKYGDLFSQEELLEIVTILAGDNKKILKYFVRKNQVVKSDEWKDYATLMFSQIDFTDSDVNQVETTAFVATRQLLLGAVGTQVINTKRNGKRELVGSMSIYECEQNKTLKILLEQPFVAAVGGRYVPRNVIKLQTPVVIEAAKLYNIKIKFDSSWVEKECWTKKCLTVSSKLSIQNFGIRCTGGIISHLYFN